MKRKINCLGLLSLLSLIALLAQPTNNEGLYGFLGFAYYLRYFIVQPDELFRLNLQKAATAAFFTQLLSLVPLMFFCASLYGGTAAVRTSFGLSFALGILSFTAALLFLELREQRGAADD